MQGSERDDSALRRLSIAEVTLRCMPGMSPGPSRTVTDSAYAVSTIVSCTSDSRRCLDSSGSGVAGELGGACGSADQGVREMHQPIGPRCDLGPECR